LLDLANIVDNQQIHFDEMEDHALEVHDSAQKGLFHLERAHEISRRQFRMESFLKVTLLVTIVGGLLIVSIYILALK